MRLARTIRQIEGEVLRTLIPAYSMILCYFAPGTDCVGFGGGVRVGGAHRGLRTTP